MKQLGLRISLTAAVASLAASFPSVASVHSDDADGTELRSQHADEATWSLLMFPHAPACLLSASEPGLDVLRVMTVPGTSTQAEGVVHPPHENVTFGSEQARDLHSVGPEADDFRDGEAYTDLWERIRAGFALPSIKSPRVARYEAQYLKSPRHLRRVIERSRPYLYFIVGELERRGMPAEIALLPIIESAYNPQAVSPKRAAGLWQFMPATGRQYGLHRDPWYDGRRDVVAATRAALDYLQFLHDMFDDWELALAAYNWGERAVLRARVKNAARGRPTRYGSLKMPDETRNYLPQLQALKNLIGSSTLLELAALPNEPYFAQMKAPEAVDVVKLARLADMPVEQFQSLNSGYRGPVIIQTTMRSILLPVDKLDLFQANLERNEEPLLTWQAYTPRRGESLKKIARKFAIDVRELREANGLHSSQQIHARHAILVPMGNVNNAQNGDLHHISALLEAANEHAASRRSISAKRLAGKTVKDNSLRARAATLSAAPGL